MAQEHGVLHNDVANLVQGVLKIDEHSSSSGTSSGSASSTTSKHTSPEERGRQQSRRNRKEGQGQESSEVKLTRLKARLEGQGYVPRIIAIGDVHGCVEELRMLLKVG